MQTTPQDDLLQDQTTEICCMYIYIYIYVYMCLSVMY